MVAMTLQSQAGLALSIREWYLAEAQFPGMSLLGFSLNRAPAFLARRKRYMLAYLACGTSVREGSINMTVDDTPAPPASPQGGLLARHPLTFFFLMAFAFSWIAWSPGSLSVSFSGRPWRRSS